MSMDKNAPEPVNEKLLTEFQPASYEEWRKAAEALLKGAPFEKRMLTPTHEGITLQPIYNQADLDKRGIKRGYPGGGDYLRGASASGAKGKAWDIAQEIPASRPKEFNDAILNDLMRGQNAVNLLLDVATANGQDPDSGKAGEVGACGVSIASLQDMETALKDVDLSAVPVYIQAGCGALPVSSLLYAMLKKQGKDLGDLKGGLLMDPLGVLVRSGSLPVSLGGALDEMAILAEYNARNAPGFGAVGVSTLPYSDGCANAVQELAFALATGAQYLRELGQRELSVDEVAPLFRFTFALGPNFFMEVAKLRAARAMWSKVVEAFGGNARARKMRLLGRTTLFNKTVNDPYVNMLRTTTEALCGVVGGVEAMHVSPFDEILRVPDTFSRRIARNTQIILQEECELREVIDPAGGSWAIETLTDEISQEAWKLFQTIESKGGMTQALEQGLIQEMVETTRKSRQKLLGQRRDSLVGTNNYPNLEEKPLESNIPDYERVQKERAEHIGSYRTSSDTASSAEIMEALGELMESSREQHIPLLIKAVQKGATIGEITRVVRAKDGDKPSITNIPLQRVAQMYEKLRAATSGNAPKIFLATMGPLKAHKVRADWIGGFFRPGGFDVVYDRPFEKPEEAVEAALASGAKKVVICSTDDIYATCVEPIAKGIKAKDASIGVYVAGAPGDNEKAFRDAGVDDFVHVKSPNYATLEQFLQDLGVINK